MNGKRLVVCIDDYALRPGVDAAVLELAATGRVSATSCLVGSPRWKEAARELRALHTIDVGLHLDFTEAPFDAGLRSGLGAFIGRAYLGALPASRIAAEIRAQFDAFEAAMGRAPDHVDGHQHVHQLPGVRGPLLEEIARRGIRPWLRGTAVPASEPGTKPRVIAALGGNAMRAAARRQDLPMTQHLLGVYPFDVDGETYAALLDRWLARAAEGDSLMCHPAAEDDAPMADPIAAARHVEHEVLRGPRWTELLARHGITVSRFATN
ncbi:ChbG/HpnK family deacetylase [Ramlibacter algicola]|uniref:ChbG/HpnK family deacetylase n=1 Tax=Ramlibacter algicola TaxID=2795217 RepID=A0A934PYG5_9BURK|nr:ChbG/HpnK family deacetylase [Ramlibacter algicola]